MIFSNLLKFISISIAILEKTKIEIRKLSCDQTYIKKIIKIIKNNKKILL